MNQEDKDRGEIVIYNTKTGVDIQVRFQGDSIWLSQKLIAELYGKDVRTISDHISNIYEELELEKEATIRNCRIVQKEGNREVSRNIEYYNLEVIIAVGYRVRSPQGTAFRKWATQNLKDFMTKGYLLNDERLKNEGDMRYFKEVLQRIRDIRSSEKLIWRQVLDIFATSTDYDGKSETAITLFKVIQNKMHYAAHKHTAAEIVYDRADASKENMGMTNFKGNVITKADSSIAKNYLNEVELLNLNAIVSTIFEFAESQALNHIPMSMQNWIDKFDALIKLNDRAILLNLGKISHKMAQDKALEEFDKYKLRISQDKSIAEKDFELAIDKIKKIENSIKYSKRKKRK